MKLQKITAAAIVAVMAISSSGVCQAATAADMTSTDIIDESVAEPKSVSNIRILHQQYPSGSRFTGTFDGASECMGFAYYCYYMYNDEHVNEKIQDNSQQYYSLATDAALENFLTKAGTQCYVRGLTRNGSVHSIFIVNYSTSADTVTVYDCNMDLNCGVLFDTYSYNEFRGHMNSVLFCYTSDCVFYDYTDF